MIRKLQATRVTATTTVKASRTLLYHVRVERSAAGAGTLVLRDGGASGTTRLSIAWEADATVVDEHPVAGIEFATDLHATLSNGTVVLQHS